MIYEKSEGINSTERFLSQLCENTFLKLWSFPNPVKDDGHELCDLIATFEDKLFIFFSRESLALQPSKLEKNGLDIAWSRWKKEAINKQLKTIRGAERYIRNGRPIFIDSKAKKELPFEINNKNIQVHRIIVAFGASEACFSLYKENITGSLGVFYSNNKIEDTPFLVGLERNDPVHLFDSNTLPLVMSEFDTISDFSEYLDAKEKAIREYDSISYAGEEDLIAHYYSNYDENSNKHLVVLKQNKKVNHIHIEEGQWLEFIKNKQYLNKKVADKSSYLWDEMIQRSSDNILKGKSGGNSLPFKGKSALHEMSKEPRFHRRYLSDLLIQAINEFKMPASGLRREIRLIGSSYENVMYIFLQVKLSNIDTYNSDRYDNEYLPKRRDMLTIACGVTKNKFPHLTKVIGIGIDAPKFSKRNSDDYQLLECSNWTLENIEYYKEANKYFNFLETNSLSTNIFTSKNFPD